MESWLHFGMLFSIVGFSRQHQAGGKDSLLLPSARSTRLPSSALLEVRRHPSSWQGLCVRPSSRSRAAVDISLFPGAPLISHPLRHTFGYIQRCIMWYLVFPQAIIRSNKDIEFQRLQTSEVSYSIVSFCVRHHSETWIQQSSSPTGFIHWPICLQWLNSMTIVAMDTTEKIHVIDVSSWEELEAIDLSDMQLVYSTSFFKGLATGGNVSPALVSDVTSRHPVAITVVFITKMFPLMTSGVQLASSLLSAWNGRRICVIVDFQWLLFICVVSFQSHAGDHACYYSMTSYRSQLFILGHKSVHVFTVRTWLEV